MGHQGHLYKLGVQGRSMTSAPGVGGPTFVAHLTCAHCGKCGERRLRAVMPPEQIDRKFVQAGWRLDPHACPDCTATATKEKNMASKPSPAAMKAQARMFALLTDHFDAEAGAYSPDWNDARVAQETGLAADVITEFRRAGFGEIKEPADVRALREDIQSLANLQSEQHGTFTSEIASLRTRLADLSKRWAA